MPDQLPQHTPPQADIDSSWHLIHRHALLTSLEDLEREWTLSLHHPRQIQRAAMAIRRHAGLVRFVLNAAPLPDDDEDLLPPPDPHFTTITFDTNSPSPTPPCNPHPVVSPSSTVATSAKRAQDGTRIPP